MKVQIERATLGKDPEHNLTNAGEPKVDLWLAENKARKNPDGSWGEPDTFWWGFTAYGFAAEKVERLDLRKGDSITITDGEATTRTVGERGDSKTYTNYVLRKFQKLARAERDHDDD